MKPEQLCFDWEYTYKVIQKVLALRKQVPCRLGVIIVEAGMHYISGVPGDPLGLIGRHDNKHYYRIDELELLCEELENNPELHWLDAQNGPYPTRKPPQIEVQNRNKSRKLA